MFQVQMKQQVLQTSKATSGWESSTMPFLPSARHFCVRLSTDTQPLWARSHLAYNCSERTIPVELCSLPYTQNQTPQDCTTGFFYPYTSEKWEAWLKKFSLRTNTSYKVCTGTNINKASGTGVLNNGGKRQAYKIIWQQSYQCS